MAGAPGIIVERTDQRGGDARRPVRVAMTSLESSHSAARSRSCCWRQGAQHVDGVLGEWQDRQAGGLYSVRVAASSWSGLMCWPYRGLHGDRASSGDSHLRSSGPLI